MTVDEDPKALLNRAYDDWNESIRNHHASNGTITGFTLTILAVFISTSHDKLNLYELEVLAIISGLLLFQVSYWLNQVEGDRQIRYLSLERLLLPFGASAKQAQEIDDFKYDLRVKNTFEAGALARIIRMTVTMTILLLLVHVGRSL